VGFSKDEPLYVAADWAGADQGVVDRVLHKLQAAGYTVVQSQAATGLPREVRAQVEFEVALHAKRFMGNSLSAFSALAILQRRHLGMWAGHYNGGEIKMLRRLPLAPTPWVFTFNSWSPAREPGLKAAVNSALQQGGIAPMCVFAGNASAPIATWLEGRGVRVLHHNPAWRPRMLDALRKHAAAKHAPNLTAAQENAIVSAWQHIDLPVVQWVDQYTHVLLTEADSVVFNRPISLTGELPHLPSTVASASAEGVASVDGVQFTLEGDVALVNLPGLRTTYNKFVEFVLKDGEGLMLQGYGPHKQVGLTVGALGWLLGWCKSVKPA